MRHIVDGLLQNGENALSRAVDGGFMAKGDELRCAVVKVVLQAFY